MHQIKEWTIACHAQLVWAAKRVKASSSNLKLAKKDSIKMNQVRNSVNLAQTPSSAQKDPKLAITATEENSLTQLQNSAPIALQDTSAKSASRWWSVARVPLLRQELKLAQNALKVTSVPREPKSQLSVTTWRSASLVLIRTDLEIASINAQCVNLQNC